MPETPNIKSRELPEAPRDTRPAPVAYAELDVTTNFSFLRGASHPDEMVFRAAELGYRAVAITDRNSLAGVVRAHDAVRQVRDQGGVPPRLVIGARLTLADGPDVLVWPTDRAAYGRLCRLLTAGKRRAEKGECLLYLQDLLDHQEGMLAAVVGDTEGIGCWGSGAGNATKHFASPASHILLPTPDTLSFPSLRLVRPALAVLRDAFGDRLSLAAAAHYGPDDVTRLSRLADLAKCFDTPLLATNHVHYHDAARRELQDVLTCVRHLCTIDQAGYRLFPNGERYLKPPDTMARAFVDYSAAIARGLEIAERCAFSLDQLKYEYPDEVVPAGVTAIEHLRRLAYAGAVERYGGAAEGIGYRVSGIGQTDSTVSAPDTLHPIPHTLSPDALSALIPPRVRDLLERELTFIAQLKYETYFLTVYDLVRFANSRGILCQGRGSAANSAVCYCLGVTSVDPMKIDLLFERFVSAARNEPPDIDVDFEHERREEVIQYLYEKYGRDRAGMTAEVITYRGRSAVRDVGKALGLSLDLVDSMAKKLDWWHRGTIGPEMLTELGLDPNDRTIRKVVDLTGQLLGFPRHLSQHVGGMVMTRGPLCEMVPIENASMPDRTVIEWDKDDIDAVGILKVDALALGMLTAISKAFAFLNGHSRDEMPDAPRLAATRRASAAQPERERAGADDDGASDEHTPSPEGATKSSPGGEPWGPDETIPIFTPHIQSPEGATDSSVIDPHPSFAPPGLRGDVAPSPQGLRPGLLFAAPPGLPLPRRSVTYQLHTIPNEDPAVYAMISDADTVGVFQIESRAQMSMLPRLKPNCFYDLVIEVAIVRPGPIQGDMVHPYLRRRNKEELVSYPSPALRDVLAKTLGVPLFQEQAMRVAMVGAGFSADEADQLRRAMAAWKRSGAAIEKFHAKIVTGMLANGYTREFAEQCFNQIKGFGEYGFPESHAASFARLVYVSAWIRRHHPAAFCAALLNSQPMGFYAPAQLVRDAKEHGVTVRAIDVNASEWDCTLEEKDEGGRMKDEADAEPRLAATRRASAAPPEGERVGADSANAPFRVCSAHHSRNDDCVAHFHSPDGATKSSPGRKPWVRADAPPTSFHGNSPEGATDGTADRATARHRSFAPPGLGEEPLDAGGAPPSSQGLRPGLLFAAPSGLDTPPPKSTWGIPGPAVRLGFRLIKGLRETFGHRIADARKRVGRFTSIPHFRRATGLPAHAIRRLAEADAFGSLGLPRRIAVWEALSIRDEEMPLFEMLEDDAHPEASAPGRAPQAGRLQDEPTHSNQPAIRDPQSEIPPHPSAPLQSAIGNRQSAIPTPFLPPMPLNQEVLTDYATTTLSLKKHPVELVRDHLASLRIRTAAEVLATENAKWVKVAGLVLIRQRPGTASGIVFETLEDETGVINLIVKPDVFERYRQAARHASLLQCDGYVQRQGQVVHVMAKRLFDLSHLVHGYGERSRDFH